jgi:HD-GYP domain-containing protein (c-di-GMP phosphodiesterase class II)
MAKKNNPLSLVENSQALWGNIEDWTYSSLHALMECLRVTDPLTHDHCFRVAHGSSLLAEAMGLNEYQQNIAYATGLLHDIGKVGIPKDILHKPAPLSQEEYELVKNHPLLSESIVAPLAEKNSFLKETLSGIRGHHERLDGTGYPDKKKGDHIPLMARVVLIADTFDAMSNHRAYRQGLATESIYAELKKFSGLQFDSQIVKVFLESHPKWATAPEFYFELQQKKKSA